ncbi:MAG: potassium transporter Kup [Gemmatimonadota bacterium]|nr:potassium transporter Kup [Gemmatimonadota bacterium]
MSYTHGGPPPKGKALAALAFAALGVVYGDIGTSPLYALKECFGGPHSLALTRDNLLGVLSLIFWSLNFLISFKYVVHMLRADNRGEGGILALLALLNPSGLARGPRWALISAGLFGSALLYGDGIITPAISVIGAVEGLAVAAPALERWVLPISIGIVVALFSVQRRGTAMVGQVFGPVTTLWFLCIAALGVYGIAQAPEVLGAVNPWQMVSLVQREGSAAFFVLAAVVLVVTGGEALYADMGHFGKRPIRLAWFVVVLPALLLNYFGQGALLLRDPAAAANPFYNMVPGWALYPMIAIATSAAVVASQALISGAFSLTQQAVQLGYSPRVTIVHTSERERGQIYIPQVNWGLMVACIALMLAFKTTSNLAGTYGVAVCGTMTFTTILFCAVARERWHWPRWKVTSLGGLFLVVDLMFFAANIDKIPHGGWVPLLIAGLIFTLMATWKRGRIRLTSIMESSSLPMDLFLGDAVKRCVRVPGTAVFMTSHAGGAPPVLLHHVKHNKVLHEQVILMSVRTRDIPYVPSDERMTFKELGEKFYDLTAEYGFMESPNVPDLLRGLQAHGVSVRPLETTYYLGRETLIVTPERKPRAEDAPPPLSTWRKRLFVIMSRNAQSATAFFGLPPNRVVEMGAQIQF